MGDDAKSNLRVLAAGVERAVPNAPGERRAADKGSWLVRKIAPLVAGLALVASPANVGCSDDSQGVEDVQDADAQDVEEDGSAPDSDVEEADAVEEDGGADPDVDLESVEDAGCTTTIHYYATGDFLEENVGESRQREETWYRQEQYSGPGCDAEAGEMVFEKIMFRLETPIPDISEEGLREVVRKGGITKGFRASLDQKILEIANEHLKLATIINGEILGPPGSGYRTEILCGDRMVAMIDRAGTNPDGTKYAGFTVLNREGFPVANMNVNEGEYYTLPNGNRLMATGIDVPARTARVDILEPGDDIITNGTIRTREEDGMQYRFQMELPDGWSLYPAEL